MTKEATKVCALNIHECLVEMRLHYNNGEGIYTTEYLHPDRIEKLLYVVEPVEDGSRYECSLCPIVFTNALILIQHLNKVHIEKGSASSNSGQQSSATGGETRAKGNPVYFSASNGWFHNFINWFELSSVIMTGEKSSNNQSAADEFKKTFTAHIAE